MYKKINIALFSWSDNKDVAGEKVIAPVAEFIFPYTLSPEGYPPGRDFGNRDPNSAEGIYLTYGGPTFGIIYGPCGALGRIPTGRSRLLKRSSTKVFHFPRNHVKRRNVTNPQKARPRRKVLSSRGEKRRARKSQSAYLSGAKKRKASFCCGEIYCGRPLRVLFIGWFG